MDLQTLINKVESRDYPIDLAAIIEVFSQPIPQDIAEMEDMGDVVLNIKDMFVADGDYTKVEAFVKILETHQPDIMVSEGKYFYQDFIEYFCAAGDFERAEFYFEPFIKDPLNDFDFYLMIFKKLLFYQRNTILLRAIQQNYAEVRNCEELMDNAIDLYDAAIYYLAVQEVYEKSDQHFDIKLLARMLNPYNFEFSEDPVEVYQLGFYEDTPDPLSLKESFRKDKDALLMLLRNIFMKRMLSRGLQFTVSGFMFDNTRNYWDMKSPNKGNWKTYFNMTSKTFDDFLIGLKGSLLGENYEEMIAFAFGVAYVYDFLLEIEIIDDAHYAEFQVLYKQRIAELMGSSLPRLFAKAYVVQWPKSEAVTDQEWEAQKSIFKKSLAYQNDPSIDLIAVMQDDFDGLGAHKEDLMIAYELSVERRREMQNMMQAMDELDDEFDEDFYKDFEANYNKEFEDDDDFIDVEESETSDYKSISSSTPYVADAKPGRNEPCPCGSGKKYKKCCGKAN